MIKFKNNHLIYEKSIHDNENYSTVLPKEVVEKLKNDLIKINILNWKRKYDEEHINAGIQW